VLKAVCVLCLITYAAVIGLFLISGISTTIPMTTILTCAARDLRKLAARPLAVAIVLIFAVASGSAVALFPRDAGRNPAQQAAAPQQDQRKVFEEWFAAQPRVTVPVPGGGAAVLIVKFTDFQCPSCGQTYREVRPILEKYQALAPGAVKLVSKMYPLQPDCNVNVPRVVHGAACDSAAAWIMARPRGRADAMEDWLYTNQTLLSPAAVKEAARTVGMILDYEAQYPRVLEEIKGDVALGRLLNVRVTPTFFINGVKFDGGLGPEYFDLAVGLELRKAGKIK
jgi:protein-disulfide isomerase